MEENTEEYTFEELRLSFLGKVITNQEMFDRVGAKRLQEFVKTFEEIYNDSTGYDNQHTLKSYIRSTTFQEEFRDIVGIAYGEHAKRVLEERPNLTIANIPTFKVFDKQLADTFGENFTHQLLNFDYSQLGIPFNAILTDLTEDKQALETFKYCYDTIRGESKEVFDYTRAFKLYSSYRDLFADCYRHRDQLSVEQYSRLKDVISSYDNSFGVRTVADLDTYPEKVKAHFDNLVKMSTSPDAVSDIIFERFFGLKSGTNAHKRAYTRTTTRYRDLFRAYNIPRLIAIEEHAEELQRQKVLSPDELSLLKLVKAVSAIGSYNSWSYSKEECKTILTKLYWTLDAEAAQGKLVTPGDFMELINKVPELYKQDLKNNLTDISDLEKAVQENSPKISKEFVEVRASSGNMVQIPVYHLRGAEYKFLTTTTEANMSINTGSNMADPDAWFTYENGISHVSCSLTTDKIRGSLEFDEFYRTDDSINYIMDGKKATIISEGHGDIFSSNDARDPDMYSDESTSFAFTRDLEGRTYNYNEICIERYQTDSNHRAGKVIPAAIFKRFNGESIEEFSPRLLRHAADMTEYVRNNLGQPDYVMPVVLMHPQNYSDNSARLYSDTINQYVRDNKNIEKEHEFLEQEIEAHSDEELAPPPQNSDGDFGYSNGE